MTEDLLPSGSAPALAAAARGRWLSSRAVRPLLKAAVKADPALWVILSIFLALTGPRLATVPMWDSRIYYDGCLMPALEAPFDLLRLNCFGHPSMLYMILLIPGQWLRPGSAVLLNLTNVGLGCLAIAAFWVLAGLLQPGPERRRERLLATAIFAVWPAAVGSSLNMAPDYGALVFFLIFLAFLLKERVEFAAIAGMFLVFSKESGVLLYGSTTAIFLAAMFLRPTGLSIRERWRKILDKKILLVPAILYILVTAFTFTRPRRVVWGGSSLLLRTLKRFVLFNPGEIFFGRYGPAIWVLSFSWILSASLLVAALQLSLSSRARELLRSEPIPKRTLVLLLLILVGAVYVLTRFETYTNVRYLLPIVPLLILTFVIAVEVVFPRPLLRQATLGITFLLLLGSNFRTLDPVSRAVWGTFPFGRHELLKLTSWMNECCGYSRDQLVYNLEYLKIHELQNAMFQDLRPGPQTTFVANSMADWFLAGRVAADGRRTLHFSNARRVRFFGARFLESRRSPPPEAVYFVAFPNFDNGEEFERLRRHYEVTSTKSYEISGYSLAVYAMQRKHASSCQAAHPRPAADVKIDAVPAQRDSGVGVAVRRP